MILVVGATGLTGTEVCKRLMERGKEVRAMVRASSYPAKVTALKQMGAEIVYGDLRGHESLRHAVEGVETVITTASSMPFTYKPGENDIQTTDLNGEKKLIELAKAAGVKHFIYTSFSGALDQPFPLRNAKREVEAALKASGLTYTILRPTMFMEVWLSPAVGFDAANAKAVIYGTGDKPLSWISLVDVAEIAVQCVDTPAAKNAVFEMGGPEALTPLEVVKVFEGVTGKTFEVNFVPAEALKQQMDAATDPMQKSFSGLMLGYAAGDPIDMTELLKSMPAKLTTVREYAERVAKPMMQPA
jgi:NADH dehydrogenase